jgi:hypothetical protein
MTIHIAEIDAREYSEGFKVHLVRTDGVYVRGVPEAEWQGHGRLAIQAFNEGGNNCTQIDLLHLMRWLRRNRPEFFQENKE